MQCMQFVMTMWPQVSQQYGGYYGSTQGLLAAENSCLQIAASLLFAAAAAAAAAPPPLPEVRCSISIAYTGTADLGQTFGPTQVLPAGFANPPNPPNRLGGYYNGGWFNAIQWRAT